MSTKTNRIIVENDGREVVVNTDFMDEGFVTIDWDDIKTHCKTCNHSDMRGFARIPIWVINAIIAHGNHIEEDL